MFASIGIVLKEQGNLVAALREYRKAAAIVEKKAPGSLTLAQTFGNIGNVLRLQGNLAAALREQRKAAAVPTWSASSTFGIGALAV